MVEDPELMPELAPSIASLLQAYEAETARDPAQVEMALQQVSAKVGAVTFAAVGGGLSVTAKMGLATVLLGVAGVAGVVGVAAVGPSSSAPSRASAAAFSPAKLEVSPPPRSETAESSRADESTAAKPPHARGDEAIPPHRPRKTIRRGQAPTPAPTESEESLRAELELLRKLRKALRGGRAVRAMELVRRHKREYPKSSFAEERDATEVSALCVLGRDEEALRKAAAYQRRFPASARDVLGGCR